MISGNGSVTPETVSTRNSDGVARATRWTLGSTAGVNVLRVSVTNGPMTETREFRATGVLIPTSIMAITPTTQEARVSSPVATPPGARVFDQNGNPLPGVAVAFSVAQGGGSVLPASVVTGPDGMARAVTWTLGATPGANSATATIATLSSAATPGSASASFAAEGLGPYSIRKLSPTTQQALAGQNVPQPPAVDVRDRNGNAMPNVAVLFTAVTGGGSVSPTSVVTGADGVARLTRWMAGSAGPNVVHAKVNGLVEMVFRADALQSSVGADVSVAAPPRTAQPGTDPVFGVGTPVARLGSESLTSRGDFAVASERKKQLDCKQFGPSYVMVGMRGKHGYAIDEMQLGCSAVQANGSLSQTVVWTALFDDFDILFGSAFERRCPAGKVVSAIRGTVHSESGQIRSVAVFCMTLGSNGLTTGTAAFLPGAGTHMSTEWGPDNCSRARPARAMRLAAAIYRPNPLIVGPWIISGVQLICEQPVVP